MQFLTVAKRLWFVNILFLLFLWGVEKLPLFYSHGMKRYFRIALLATVQLYFATLAFGQEPTPQKYPKLVVEIVVSQMPYAYIQQFAQGFGHDGFLLLTDSGTVFHNAQHDYLITQPLSGIATIATGTHPSTHGIISNIWFSMANKEKVYALRDESVTTVGGNFGNGKFSPKNIIGSTLGDELRLNNPRSKVIGIALEPGSAIALSGHSANAGYWMDVNTGRWISNTYYMDSLPHWVNNFNAKDYASIYLNKEWALIDPMESYREANILLNEAKPASDKSNSAAANVIMRKTAKGNFKMLLESPFGNTYTKDMAIEAIASEGLGQDEHTDLLTIVFTPPRTVNQRYGAFSTETEDLYRRLDMDLAHLIRFLNLEIGEGNYLLVLTSDQGAQTSLQRLKASGIPTGTFEWPYAEILLNSYLGAIYGSGQWVLGYHAKQFYLNRRLIEDSRLSLRDFQEHAAQFLLQFSGVNNAITAHNLQTNGFSHGIFHRFQNSFNPKRSGDIIINLEPGWIEQNSQTSAYGSPYNYDTHVPLIWYGWNMEQQEIHTPISITHVAPTISKLLNINFPNGSHGEPILEIIK